MATRRVLAALLTAFGLVCMAIALAHVAIGPRAIPGGVVTTATMDSEDRFYATLFLGFGAAMVWACRDLVVRRRAVEALLAVFFAGGVARLVSAAAVGLPNSLFISLGLIELLLPPIAWLALRRVA